MSINKSKTRKIEPSNLIWPKYLTTVGVLNRGDPNEKKDHDISGEIISVFFLFLK